MTDIDKKREEIGRKVFLLFIDYSKRLKGEGEDFPAAPFHVELLRLLDEEGVVIKGNSLGGSHPHLASYFTVENLVDEKP